MSQSVWFVEILSIWAELKIWTSIMRSPFSRGGMKKFWKFPDMTNFRRWADCQWATWQHNFRWELRQWVRNHTELEWWPSWTIPAIFWYMPISPRCRNCQSRNNSVMHQSEMEVYQIFFHQSIFHRLMNKWYWCTISPTSGFVKALGSPQVKKSVSGDGLDRQLRVKIFNKGD